MSSARSTRDQTVTSQMPNAACAKKATSRSGLPSVAKERQRHLYASRTDPQFPHRKQQQDSGRPARCRRSCPAEIRPACSWHPGLVLAQPHSNQIWAALSRPATSRCSSLDARLSKSLRAFAVNGTKRGAGFVPKSAPGFRLCPSEIRPACSWRPCLGSAARRNKEAAAGTVRPSRHCPGQTRPACSCRLCPSEIRPACSWRPCLGSAARRNKEAVAALPRQRGPAQQRSRRRPVSASRPGATKKPPPPCLGIAGGLGTPACLLGRGRGKRDIYGMANGALAQSVCALGPE
jgi:hypothetical protein